MRTSPNTNKTKYLINNGVASFVQQAVTLICGLIVPRLIIGRYGSAANGTIATITQLISITSLIQGGVASSVRVAFYGPIVNKDKFQISRVYNTSQVYFQRFAAGLLVYTFVLSLVYKKLFDSPFSYAETLLLVIIIGISAIVEYLFGITNQLLLFASQKGYINSLLFALFTCVSSITAVLLINSGFSIIVVKFTSGLILSLRPISLFFIAKRLQSIDSDVSVDFSSINQRHAALAKSVAFHIHSSTDTIVISMFLSPIWASVYTVHRYVVNSVSTIASSVLGNTEVVFGHTYAEGDKIKLSQEIGGYDLFAKMLSATLFFTAMILISPFVKLYTSNTLDATYFHPTFAVLLCAAEMIYCMSLPYHNMIMAAGHISQTKWISITEAIINLVISMILVGAMGIEGVALGTIAAFVFNTIANIWYMKKNIINEKTSTILMLYFCNIIPGLVLYRLLTIRLIVDFNSISQFILKGILVFVLVFTTFMVTNTIIFKKYSCMIFNMIIRKIKTQTNRK